MERAWYSNVCIGLNDLKTKGVYEWSDGSSVSWTNWYVGQPDEGQIDKTCVFMSLIRGKRGWMYWRDQNCSNKYAFVCAYTMERTTQKPATVPTAINEKCNDAGWVTNENSTYCYYYEGSTSGTHWLGADTTCWYKSAKLVSIQSKEENDFVRKLSNNIIRLGLEAKGVFRAATDIAENATSYDGTWSKRGYTANFVVGFVISVETGEVLDFDFESNLRSEYTSAKKYIGEDSPEYAICDGYGNPMEVSGILMVAARIVQNVRVLISDRKSTRNGASRRTRRCLMNLMKSVRLIVQASPS
ncbi:Hypothetical predicted protein [Paramuricea clavata]|uniref:Uncharacterized protein n=1 Tax=Paramuricea clavata TaxID=317549 RepID=A0A7D9ISH5_PARCT|nr:Hypothetical predicted protein [Paramuricea clavata]